MTSAKGPAHVVVDGSNIATEGRSLPSLAQLNDAVMSFMEEHPDTAITVVVDATFGHRIDKKEAKDFEEGISNNELVAPPAGAVGRGDAFVLSIAQKANASILSNDSFQEFHGDYEWLFDEGRLIGGKPVPHVGWVFVDRVPVRGPISRKATGGGGRGSGRRTKKDAADTPSTGAKGAERGGRKASAAASAPMPVPKSPPPGRSAATTAAAAPEPVSADDARRPVPRAGEVVNDLMPFLEFVEHHPVGTSVNGTVDSYSSHGAYVTIGSEGVRAYVPLRLMADPPPTSARKVMKIGESVTLVVVSFAAARRSIDCAVPDLAGPAIDAARADASGDRPEVSLEEAVTEAAVELAADDGDADDVTGGRGRRGRSRRGTRPSPTTSTTASTTAGDDATPAEQPAVTKVAAKKTAAKKAAAKKTAAKKTAAKTTTAKKAAAKRAPATKTAAKTTTAATRATKTPVTKTTAAKKSAPATKAAAEQPATTQPAARKATAKQTAPKKSAAKKTVAKKSAAKKSPAKKSAAKKSVAKKSATRTTTARSRGGDASSHGTSD